MHRYFVEHIVPTTTIVGLLLASASTLGSAAAVAFTSNTNQVCSRLSSGSMSKHLFRSMTASASDTQSDIEKNDKRLIRVLALHGSEGDGATISKVLDDWRNNLLVLQSGIDLETTVLDAPFEKGGGYAWWTMPPGVRSFNAQEYKGFDHSSTLVLDALKDGSNSPFDLILGHSQGATLLSALLALNRITAHPKLGYALNGVAWPNPYASELEALRIVRTDDADAESTESPRVLLIVGERDAINPPEGAEQVGEALASAGCRLTTVRHPGGHSVPISTSTTPEVMRAIAKWIADH